MKTTMTMEEKTKKKLKEFQLRWNFKTQEEALLVLLKLERQFKPELKERKNG